MKQFYSDVIEWDHFIWKKSLDYWDSIIKSKNTSLNLGLELGSRNGGMSLYFAYKYCSKCVCSDLNLPTSKAKFNHSLYQVNHLIEYQCINALQIPYPDDYFDFIVFKSILGDVGNNNQFLNQRQAINEIYRVLKPGGFLFFSENAKSSLLHQISRIKFMPWGSSWRYLDINEMHLLLNGFSESKIKCHGFISAFIKGPRPIKFILAQIDKFIDFIPKSWKYVMYGYAIK